METAAIAAPAAGTRSSAESQPEIGMLHWKLSDWLSSVGVAKVLAEALLGGATGSGEGTQLEQTRSIAGEATTEQTIAERLQLGRACEMLAELLLPELRKLTQAHAIDSDTQSKFAGAIELSYGGLDTFFGGLEGQVGAPDPQVFDAMEAEHTRKSDSRLKFVTGNYGITTSSEIEWAYVLEPTKERLARLRFSQWPAEAEKKLPEGHRRRAVPLAKFEAKMEEVNGQLRSMGQPELTRVELIGGRLYSGPLFVKYNAVLRGYNSDSDFLTNHFVALCCPKDVADAYLGGARLYDPHAGAVSFATARASANRYTTTMHAINSSIVKASKVTMATKVYRGISGMALPKEFLSKNCFGVAGGVETAFMSTTTDRAVAMSYAGCGEAGIVFEIQMGMVDRGADIAWLSQYPHEREILFAPLSGLEVQSSRVDGSVVVLEMRLSVNLASLTMEQVMSKRRKVVQDMCKQLIERRFAEIQKDGDWQQICASVGKGADNVASYLRALLDPIAGRETTFYNQDAQLGCAINDAVKQAGRVASWPQKLRELVAAEPRLLTSPVVRIDAKLADPVGVAALVLLSSHLTELDLHRAELGPDGATMLAAAIAHGTAPLRRLYLAENSLCGVRRGEGTYSSDGFARLCEALALPGCGIETLDLRGNAIYAAGAALLGAALQANTTVRVLDLSDNRLWPNGVASIAEAVRGSRTLQELNVSGNDAKADGAARLAEALVQNRSLRVLQLARNDLSAAGAVSIAAALRENQSLTHLDLSHNCLGSDGAAHLAEALGSNHGLTSLDISNNNLRQVAAAAFVEALKSNTSLTELNMETDGVAAALKAAPIKLAALKGRLFGVGRAAISLSPRAVAGPLPENSKGKGRN